MKKIETSDLLDLEAYEARRAEMRSQVMEKKKRRLVAIGDHVSLLFEDYDTIFYQVMEMLRIERTTDAAGIRDELEAYNPLLPEGSNLKATMLIEYTDVAERQVQLKMLRHIEHKIWCKVGEQRPVYAAADEDMERSDDEKTSAVHFLAFNIDTDAIEALKAGAALEFGSDHPNYHYSSGPLSSVQRTTLIADFD